jgi:AraC-like DNA-binding protein
MDWRVSKLIDSIDSHSGGIDWSLEHLCRDLRFEVSPAYAAQLFKRDTGQGVREYAKRKRLTISAELLTTTNLPIKVIAAELGYKSAFHFSRLFKEEHHLTPQPVQTGPPRGPTLLSKGCVWSAQSTQQNKKAENGAF